MVQTTKIEWTNTTWNPATGCTYVSDGCTHCYARGMAGRLQTMENQPKYRNGFEVTTHPEDLDTPKSWRKPRIIFVCSMSDLFHEKIPISFVKHVFRTMNDCPWHTFQVLTKRSERAVALLNEVQWTPNIWAGVTIENSKVLHRMAALAQIPAAVRFISAEPLIGPLDGLSLQGVDWMIVGGESGSGARAMDPKWARDIRDACVGAGVPFFFKQWGGVNNKKAGRVLDGRTWDEMPPTLTGLRKLNG